MKSLVQNKNVQFIVMFVVMSVQTSSFLLIHSSEHVTKILYVITWLLNSFRWHENDNTFSPLLSPYLLAFKPWNSGRTQPINIISVFCR